MWNVSVVQVEVLHLFRHTGSQPDSDAYPWFNSIGLVQKHTLLGHKILIRGQSLRI